MDGGQLNLTDIRCPSCGTNTLVLSGQSLVPQREIVENGVTTDVTLGEYADGAFNLQRIDCMNCNTQFIIKDHALFRLEQENHELRQKLAAHEGRPPDGGYVN